MFVSLMALALAAAPESMPQDGQAVASPVPSATPPAASPPAVPPSAAQPLPPAPGGGEASGNIGFFTADALARRCQDSSPTAISYCYAYITAVHDTMKAYEIWLNQREFCMKGGNAQADLRRAFLTYLSAYPQNGGGQAASVVAVALKQSYVCSSEPQAAPGAVPSSAPLSRIPR